MGVADLCGSRIESCKPHINYLWQQSTTKRQSTSWTVSGGNFSQKKKTDFLVQNMTRLQSPMLLPAYIFLVHRIRVKDRSSKLNRVALLVTEFFHANLNPCDQTRRCRSQSQFSKYSVLKTTKLFKMQIIARHSPPPLASWILHSLSQWLVTEYWTTFRSLDPNKPAS